MSQDSPRPVIITGNWKMYKTIEESLSFVKTLSPLIAKSQATVFLAVPFTAIDPTVKCFKELKAAVSVGAQNMNDCEEGAFTGEIAGKMLVGVGAKFVILGHSERRHVFNETNAFINRKVKRALKDKLQPVVCVGETLEQRQAGTTEEVLKNQLLESLEGLSEEEIAKLILAYEPVWAIGTGQVAHPSDAQTAHLFCRGVIASAWGELAAQSVVIQYGGSVKPENAADLLAQDDIDGLLVGGASLSAESFGQIINSYVHPDSKL
ncbi:MAG: Triosephosphate isomerase [Chlamydiales bacterium]|nr:Triosephosphate isomerase [Chlamydiales bacterium]